ncbi:U-box domain-containing protein 62 [Typha latifolia]|uniref:U-box domain-containing protein 62 n=1 Tax=Typha latifolia TaxID=4733 RepID=UPI003C2E45A3
MASAENGLSSRMAPPEFAVVDGGKVFSDDRSARFFREHHHLQSHSWSAMRGGDGSDGEEDDDEEEDDVDDEDEEIDGDGLVLVGEASHKAHNNSSGSVQSSSEKIQGERASFGLNRVEQQSQQGRMEGYETAITVVEPEQYFVHALHRGDESAAPGQKDVGGENGCGFSGRRDGGSTASYWESLRTHLSDPLTGFLMEDAMILSCGHSYGSTGMQHVFRMKACCKCAQPISEDSVRPNLALRSAVQAFLREEQSHSLRASKRRRDRFEQDKSSYDDSLPTDISRSKGVQFPFAVSDRVIIKGNKRTPQRFVGRVAVVTAQCLNGWYVVKTLDNAESVKLQYRSLEKVTDEQVAKMLPNKAQPPSWL